MKGQLKVRAPKGVSQKVGIQFRGVQFAVFFLILIGSCGLSAQTTYYSKPSGNLNITGTWGSNPNGSGISPANFTAPGVIYMIVNRAVASISAAWTVSGAGSSVQVGDGTTAVDFVIPSTFSFNGPVSVTSTLTNNNTSSLNLAGLSPGSTLIYGSAGNQTVANAGYYNLVLNGGGQKSLANVLSTSISNSLIISSGVLFRLNTVNTLSTNISGSVSGSGHLVGSTNANLEITGTGDAGTLSFSVTTSLNQFRLARTGNGIVSLGSNLTVAGNFIHQNGTLSLNTSFLTLNGAIQFPLSSANRFFRGSPNASLTIGGAAPITNAILFETTNSVSRSLSRFVMNRSGQILSLGTDVEVRDQLTHSAGIIALNNRALISSGILTFPATLTNGYFIGTPASSLTIDGAGAITNTMKFDASNASTRSLASFIYNHTGGTLTFGSSLNCVSEFRQVNGVLVLGANQLNLSGGIIFPASAANGHITGSASSSLVISGTGSVSNALFMNPAGATVRTLNLFSLNRSGQSLTLGSDLIATNCIHSNGTLVLNGRSLSLTGAVTFPASAANGAIQGSSTSSLIIGASTALVTNALQFNQSSLAARSLAFLSVNRSGQIISLGSNADVTTAFIQTNGFINLNGKALSLSGTLTLPAAATNGYFIGSASSSLTIGGAGPITNALRFDQSNLPARTLSSFEVDHNIGAVTLGSHLDCDNRFVHVNGAITLGSNSLTLKGDITFPASASNGSFTGSASASLIVTGAGSVSNFLWMGQTATGARTLNYFLLNRPGQSLALGNALRVSNFVNTAGLLSLNGSSLTLTGNCNFPASAANGGFIGSPTSSLSMDINTGTISNALYFSQNSIASRSLARFAFRAISHTLALGSSVDVVSNYAHTNGVISINTNALSIGGNITFPNNGALGHLIGSAASTLNITGAGTISNALRLDASTLAGQTLDALTLNHTGGTILQGTSIICSSNFSQVNGILSIASNSLLLNGAISFPASAANGSLTGSATSTLLINGSGNISNSLVMNQTSAAASTINRFQMNRSGQTLSLGSNLIANTYLHNNGSVSLNGNLLTVNGPLGFPATAAAGFISGSTTSSLTIAGTGAITNSLVMNQTSAGSRALFDLILNRTGQTLNFGNAVEIRNMIRPIAGSIVTGGMVTLKADNLRSAMVGNVTGAMSGNITVETLAPGGFTGWTNLGPTGVSGLTVANWEAQFPMTCFSCPFNENSAGGYFVSVQSFNESATGSAAYVPLSYASPLSNGTGYWVYLGTGFFTTTAITYSVAGPVVTGNVLKPLTVSANSGQNLIANPYAAPIDWDLVSADAANANVSGSVFFYNPDLGQTISYAGGVSNPAGYIANGVIPAGQGFYVQATTATNITFRESHKSTANTNANPLLRSARPATPGTLFRLSVLGASLDYDETTIRFHQDASASFDRLLDADKQFETPGFLGTGPVYSKYTTISTRMQSKDFSINSLPLSQAGSYHIPVLVKVMSTGVYTISPLDLENLSTNNCVILKDHLLNVSHDLRKGPYTCSINDTTASPRFELEICPGNSDLAEAELPHTQKTSVLIHPQEDAAVLVQTNYDKPLVSEISAYTVTGQQIIPEKKVQGTNAEILLDLSAYRGQVVLIKVSNEQGHTIKKIIVS